MNARHAFGGLKLLVTALLVSAAPAYAAKPLSDALELVFKNALVPGPFCAENLTAKRLFSRGFRAQQTFDADRRAWLLGSSPFYGIRGVYFLNPAGVGKTAADRQFLVFLDGLRHGYARDLPQEEAAVMLHIEEVGASTQTYGVYYLSRFKHSEFQSIAASGFKNLPNDYRSFVIEQYRKRLKLSAEVLARLTSISAHVQDRSVLIAKTKESFVTIQNNKMQIYHDVKPEVFQKLDFDDPYKQWRDSGERKYMTGRESDFPVWSPDDSPISAWEFRKLPSHLTIEGGAILVWSRGPHDALPIELLTGHSVTRPKEGRVVEAGRYVVTRDQVTNVSPRMVQQIASVAVGFGDVVKIVIEADTAHRRLYEPLGFKVEHEFVNAAGEREFIMSAPPERVLGQALKRHYASFEDVLSGQK